jgi:Fe-S cluster assembly scaffold protein SufB
MRTQNLKLLIVILLIVPLGIMQAQKSNSEAFWVHEDVVKPNKVQEYESIVKELVDNMKKHNIQEVNIIVANLVDSRYLYVGPIANMAELDKSSFATLSEKMGAEAMDKLFERMDKCYDIEQDYVIHLDKELSYMPNGITQTPEGKDFRKFHYLYYAPENRAMIKEKMKAIKDMFAQKGSKEYYRVYKNGFGTRGEFYMVAVAAKDAVDYAKQTVENDVLLGEDGAKTMGDLFSNLLKYEVFEGRMRSELGYSPE